MKEKDIQDIVAMLGLRIAGLRKIKNWSQQELSERAGMSRGFLSEIENGRSMPSFEVLLKIAAAFNVQLAYFTETSDKIRLDHIVNVLPEPLREMVVSDDFIPYLEVMQKAQEWALDPDTLSELIAMIGKRANKSS